MKNNPYVTLTVQLFRVQALAAEAAGDAERAASFEAAIQSLLDDDAPEPAPPRPRRRAPVAVVN